MNTIELVADHLWRHGRLLDRRRFEHLFAGGDPALVVAAVAAYQNADGGFGQALEPDIRTPHSQPQCAEVALHVLAEAGATSDAGVLPGLLRWLDASSIDGGLPFVLASAAGYPHAPWWEPAPEPTPNLNPTAAVVGLLRGLGASGGWIDRAAAWCWEAIGEVEPDGHLLLCLLTFAEHDPEGAKLLERLEPAVLGAVTLDPDATGYVKGPLDFAPSPRSAARRWFSDADVERHLDALQRRQEADGGWPLPWDPPSETAKSEWRSAIAVNNLRILREYGAI